MVIPGAGADVMDRLLLSSRPPLPVPTHAAAAAGADGDLLELDVLWPASPSAVGLGLLAALPEDEGKKKKRAAAVGGVGGPARSAARPVPEIAAAASAMARSAPVRIPSEPARRGRWAHAVAGAGGSAEDAVVPPHEIVARRAAAHSSVLEGAGRTLKGRDLRRVRNAVLRRTGFLD